MSGFSESVVEQAARAWLESVGWSIRNGADISPGEIGAGREWFKPWRTIAGETLADTQLPELQVMIEGLCLPQRVLDLVRV